VNVFEENLQILRQENEKEKLTKIRACLIFIPVARNRIILASPN